MESAEPARQVSRILKTGALQRGNAVLTGDESGGSIRRVNLLESLMTTKEPELRYALGYSAEEHDRLMHQAALLEPCTERLFRAAGISFGHRVLDLGSGVGDVSLLLSRLVGPTGIVVGVERDAASIERAKTRIDAHGIRNVSFVRSDAGEVSVSGPFDAIVGRFILMYLPEPAQILRKLAALLVPNGVVAFLEPSWAAVRGLSAHLPFYSACASAIVESFKASGVNPEMGACMHRTFLHAGLPAPSMGIEVMLGNSAEFTGALSNILQSLQPQARTNGVSLEGLGDLSSLQERLNTELRDSGDVISWLAGHVGAWSRVPRTSEGML